MPYEYDVFLSYRRKAPIFPWVQNHFYPLLVQWLESHTAEEPRIFVDWGLETGVNWPETLKNALKRSKFLVAVWSPQYFRSSWCMAEWKTMLRRQQLLGLGTRENPKGLVYPVVFSDGKHFPAQAKDVQHQDLRDWAYSEPSFRSAPAFIQFEEKVKEISEEIAEQLVGVPDWQDWPIVEPEPEPAVNPELPRIL